jgi:succinate dehydrogenase / fumarate reductase cytochrome b subunit
VYVVAIVLLSMHLSHGIGSFLQTLGLQHPRYNRGLRLVGPFTATIIAIG